MKSPDAFRTISEVASELDVPQHVLRFWETRFSQVRPMKRGGGRRYYRPEDVALLKGIRSLLYSDGFTIKGVQKILRERGVQHVVAACGEAESTDAVNGGDHQNANGATDQASPQNNGEHAEEGGANVVALPTAASVPSHLCRDIELALDELGSLKKILDRARG